MSPSQEPTVRELGIKLDGLRDFMEETLTWLRDAQKSHTAQIEAIAKKQGERDAVCSAERQSNSEMNAQIIAIWKRLDEFREKMGNMQTSWEIKLSSAYACRSCLQTETLTRHDERLQLLVRLAWAMLCATGSLALGLLFAWLKIPAAPGK